MIRFFISNAFIGIFTVPVYILLKEQPFFVVFPVSFLVTLSVLLLFFYFLSKKFITGWAFLTKVMVTLPTSLSLSALVKALPTNPFLDYLILFGVGYLISTPLLILSFYILIKVEKWLKAKRS